MYMYVYVKDSIKRVNNLTKLIWVFIGITLQEYLTTAATIK